MSSIILDSPYPTGPNLQWIKGNLHAHSTRSDGRLDMQEVVRRYAAIGHGFLEVSDHDLPADYSGIDACGMTLIGGSEVSASGPHVLNVGGAGRIDPGERQRAIDAIRASGGQAVLCHPNWGSTYDHFPQAAMKSLTGYAGMEIYNGGVDWEEGDGFALNNWDMLLSAGRRVWGFANDDSHADDEIGRGWNVVRAAEPDEAAILSALRAGAFYASSGVTIESIVCQGSVLHVEAPDAEAIMLIGEQGRRYALVEGRELTFDAGSLLTPYLRVDCHGRGARRAWSQPIRLGGPALDRLHKLLAERPVLRAPVVDRQIELTGRMSDPAWSRAEPATTFYLLPLATEPPVQTEVRAVLAAAGDSPGRAGQTLFLAVRSHEPNMAGLKMAADEGRVWTDDSIEFYFDPAGRGESYYCVQVNAAGKFATKQPTARPDWPGLAARASRDDRGWTVELAVPLGPMNASGGPGGRLRFNVHRNRAQDHGNMSWSWGGRAYAQPEHCGWIDFVA